MVDIHSHILPGLDDGSPAFDVSLNMARMAREAGTTDIVATPHANTSYRYEPEVIAERIVELQNAVEDGIKIHRGCDFHLSPQNIQTALWEPSRFSVNGLSYLLVEFPEATLFQGIEQVFNNLMSAGLTPIVTHPERNQHLTADIPRLRRWVGRGIPLQITTQSLLGKFGPERTRWSNDQKTETTRGQSKIGSRHENKKWLRLLAYVTGSVNQELLLQNEYLAAENRILRAKLPSRLRLSDPERANPRRDREACGTQSAPRGGQHCQA